MSGILVVFYSRSGTTRRVASEVARALGAVTEEVVDDVDRAGISGYLRSCAEAVLRVGTHVQRPRHDPADFDLVVFCAPTWAGSVPSPMRSFLWQYGWGLRRVAFVATCGGRGADGVIDQMRHLCSAGAAARRSQRERAGESGKAPAASQGGIKN